MSGVRYADLVDGASARIVAGVQAVRLRPFDDRDQARVVLRDFHAVLDALETHTWTLITPSRLAGLPAATRAEPAVADAIAMVDGIRELVGPDRPHPSMLDLADRDWSQAALHLRGASDLIGVHLDRWGHPRSPDAEILADPSVRDTALIRVGHQLDTLLASETALGLRCLQAGVHRAEVTRWLPDLATNRTHVRHLIRANPEAPAPGNLDGLRLIGEPARADDPVLHAEDLILRIRQGVWQLAARPDYSVATLRDLTTTGLMLTAHTAAAHGSDLTARPPRIAPGCEDVVRATVAWRDLLVDMSVYRAPGPADPHIRTDALALRGLLEHLAPLDGTGPADPRAPTLLRAARTTTGELATAGGRVFAQLADHGHVHVQARDLGVDHIGEDPALLTARIAGAQVAAPATRWQATVDLWNRAASSVAPSLEPPGPAPARELDTAHVLTRVPDIGGLQR